MSENQEDYTSQAIATELISLLALCRDDKDVASAFGINDIVSINDLSSNTYRLITPKGTIVGGMLGFLIGYHAIGFGAAAGAALGAASSGRAVLRTQKNKIISAATTARRLLTQESIRDHLCPLLDSVTDDVKDVIKIVSGAALGAHLGVPVDTLVLAAMTLIITKAGIKGYCAQEKDKAATAAPTTATSALPHATILVYVNVSSKIYHLSTCRRFSTRLAEMDLASAKATCRPCQICKP